MDLRSEAQLALVCPLLADKIRAAAAEVQVYGTFLLVVSGLRTAQEQADLYNQGRLDSRHVVTNARAGQSNHNYGIAADIVPYLSGASGALNWKANTPQFQAMVAALKAQGLAWGGDWKGSLGDFDHFQLAGFPVSPDGRMKTIYAEGGDAYKRLWPTVPVVT